MRHLKSHCFSWELLLIVQLKWQNWPNHGTVQTRSVLFKLLFLWILLSLLKKQKKVLNALFRFNHPCMFSYSPCEKFIKHLVFFFLMWPNGKSLSTFLKRLWSLKCQSFQWICKQSFLYVNFLFLHRPGEKFDGKRFICDGKKNKLQLNTGQMFCVFAMFLKSLFFVWRH